MNKYDSTLFEPPAPLAFVTLRNSKTDDVWFDVPMLIDSGADITLVPQSVVERLNISLDSEDTHELMGFDGNISTASVAHLILSFCKRTFRGHYLLIDQDVGILGRNVLNRIPLLLDGPNLLWSEYHE